MNIQPPRIPDTLVDIQDFSALAAFHIEEETRITGMLGADLREEGSDFSELDLRESRLQGCSFSGSSFHKASFVDMRFASCDFSSCNFSGAYFDRCVFIDCKGLGIDLSETVMKETLFQSCKLSFACLDTGKFTGLHFNRVDFTEASMSEAKVKRFTVSDSTFVRTNFFRTPLSGVDFADSTLAAPLISPPPGELKGAFVSPIQALELIELWGVRVKT